MRHRRERSDVAEGTPGARIRSRALARRHNARSVLSVCVVSFATALLVPTRAHAQGSYRSSPLGGRSALMGNTGVVLARDGAAPFLNPATTVWIREDSVAFSVNLYTVEYAVIGQYQQPGPIDHARFGNLALEDSKFTALRFDALPSTFCFFLTVGANRKAEKGDTPADRVPQKLAACLGTTERRIFEGAALEARGASPDIPTTRASTFRREFGRVLVGPSYAAVLSDRITVGAGLHLVSTSSTAFFSAASTSIIGATAIDSSYGAVTSAHSFDLAGLVGATYALDRATTLGLSFSPPTVHVAGSADATLRSEYSADGTFSETRVGSGSFAAPVPMHVTAGMGVVFPRARLELDAAYYFAKASAFESRLATNDVVLRNGAPTVSSSVTNTVEGANAVVDTSLGIEVLLGREVSALLGFSEDFNASPGVGHDFAFGAIETARESRAMTSFGFASSSGGSELMAGVQLSMTWGKTAAIDSYVLPNEPAFASERTYGAMFVIAGSTSIATLRKTVHEITAPAKGRPP